MLKRCTKCTLPITCETIIFDDDGVCNICHNWQQKSQIDWMKRKEDFLEIVREAKSAHYPYDCIVPYSGGKDSTFTLWSIVKQFGMRPLVVSFDHSFYRPKTLENRLKTFRKLGVEVLSFTPNWHIVKKLMLEALIRRGDFCWHCHAGVFSYPVQIAIKFGVPLVIWGEGGGEYEAYFKYQEQEETDEWKFNRRIVLGMRAEDMAGFIGVELRELQPYIYPTLSEMKEKKIRNIPLGNYISWDVKKHVEIIKKELDWQEDVIESGYPGETTYEKIECIFTGVRDYLKYLKRGYSRLTHLTSLDIRHGRMSRQEAMKHINEEAKKPASLQLLLEYLELTEEQFNDIAMKHVVPPAESTNPLSLPVCDALWDSDLWYREK